jgi:DNA-dependent RNA polymerase
VNALYLSILDYIHNSEEGKKYWRGETPYPTKDSTDKSFHDFHEWSKYLSISPLQRYLNSKAATYIGTLQIDAFKNRKTRFLKSLKVADVTGVEKNLNYCKKRAKTNHSTYTLKRKLLQTSITIANIFLGFPIYFSIKLDYRGRMYAWEYLLSRTTGELKQLLCEYTETTLTLEGALNLLTAYYRFSLKCSHILKTTLALKNVNLRSMFNEMNIVTYEKEFVCEDKICYVYMLHDVLDRFLNKGLKKTGILVEIDQVCSGITFLSLLLKIKPLAEETNLLGDKPRDIYNHLMNSIPTYFSNATFKDLDGSLDYKFDQGRVLDFLHKNRSINKAILMKCGYSQGAHSRCAEIISSFKDFYKSDATVQEYKTIKAFSKQYDQFMESLFPKILEQKQYLMDVLEIRLKSSSNIHGMNIRTIDGCALSWDIVPNEVINKGYWNPISNKTSTYKLNVPSPIKRKEDHQAEEIVSTIENQVKRESSQKRIYKKSSGRLSQRSFP